MVWRARKHPGISDHDRIALSGLLFGFCGFLLMQMFGAELLAALRASIVFWVFAALTAHYAGLVEAESLTENTSISRDNQADRPDPTGAIKMP